MDRTTLLNGEVFPDDLLQAEVVITLHDVHVAKHPEIRMVAILDLQTTACWSLDTVASDGIHNQFDVGIGRDVEHEVHA